MTRSVEELTRLIRKNQYHVTHISHSAKIIIYGAGNIGKDICRVLIQRGLSVKCFLDQKAKAGDQWKGIPIYPPSLGTIELIDPSNSLVILAIHNRATQIPPIIKLLQGLGFKNIITLVELFDEIGLELGNRFWLTQRSYYQTAVTEILQGYNLWTDQYSRDLYFSLIQFRLTGNYSSLPEPDVDHQYFPSDLPPWKKPIRMVDCGAFEGDSIEAFLNAEIPLESVAAFEPDQKNFSNLVITINKHNLPNAYLWPCGVYSSTKQLGFIAGQSESSNLSEFGEMIVQCVALDDVLYNFRPTLVKMDIEGAEMEALFGARRLIEANRPGLAICLYHHPSHLWQIPLLINEWGLGYEFYIRSHAFNGFDSIMYAYYKDDAK